MTRYITITTFTQALESVLQINGIPLHADFRLRTPVRALVALIRDAYRHNSAVPITSLLESLHVSHIAMLINEVSMTEGRDAARQLTILISYAQEIGVLLPDCHPGKAIRIRPSLQAKHRLLVLFGVFIFTASTGQCLYRLQDGDPKLTDITPFVYFMTACLGCWNWIAQNYKD